MKKKLLYIGIVAIVLVGGFAIYSYRSASLAKCPSAYGTDEAGSAEYLAATNKWTNDFFDTNPDATLMEWAEARRRFWIANDCTKELQAYENAKAGKVDPKKMQEVEGILRDAINNPTP